MSAEREGEDRSSGLYSWFKELLQGEPSTRAELLKFLRDRRWEGVLEPEERAMLQDVLEVSETQVREVMVPRSQMVVLESTAPKEEVLRIIRECGHSRFPVVGEERDEVVGILLAKDLLRYFMDEPNGEFDVQPYMRPATFIPESKRLNTLLKEFRISRNHMAIVVDEYGGIAGLLTIEDVLEEIVGEIDDEHDPRESDPIQPQSNGCFHVQALARIDDFNEFFSSEFSDEDYDTVGGLIIHELGRLPRRGETVALAGLQFKVLQADRRRVHMLEVSRVAAAD